MKALFFILFLCSSIGIAATPAFSQIQGLLLDDFEGEISGGPEGTVDFGSGCGSSIEVAAATDIKYSGEQSLKVTYKVVPYNYSYLWVIRGLVKPEDIYWEEFDAIAFYMYGSDSKTRIAFDIIDNGFEMWRFIVEDNFTEWEQTVCPFSEFYVRGDWQPGNADKNSILDFPIRDFQFIPLSDGETKEGTVYFDKLELINK